MSILIRGMEMPYGCADCDFCGGIILPDGIYCCDCPAEASHGKNISDAIDNDTRADFCPLVEVKEPHGRLIDADELANKTFYSTTGAPYITYKTFCDAPTVIEAEGSEE
jgi:hypothetical protein